MRKLAIFSFLCVLASNSIAQGYVGAVASLTSIGIDCADKLSCDKKGFGLRLYAGTKLAPENQYDFQIGKVSAIEIGVLSFGKASSSYDQSYTAADLVNGGTYTLNRQVSKVSTANALTVSAVAEMPVSSEFAFLAKLGVAYVSSTTRTYIDGASNGSETATKLKPYLGLGASFLIMDSLKVVGNYDVTAFDVAGRKSRINSLGFGAEMSF